MKKLLLTTVLALSFCFAVNAQDETVTENPAEVTDSKTLSLDELKTQRAALLALSKSEDFLEKLAKVDKLQAPKETGIGGLDALTTMAAKLIDQMKTTRGSIPQFYASVTGQTMDGNPATNVTPIQPDQLIALSKMFVTMGVELVKSSKELLTMPGEIKSAGVMKAMKALKSMAYIKNAFVALKQEISYNAKMTQNLIATNKAMAGDKSK
ncbi:hypothetical protein EZ428_02140 [Pedobacter frigiditerrae]|uniref:DUF4142 domain-containing protein n=1 Tax=Pedobacter frigiditerrae TaxID=2530452 RepID=A0A4R0N4W0_9SPHI|nr:hypothetical protein [Pedobacter frigiditerrae]TCC93592.1 hypothetical protein EZ428_02140 [Pedobacter frigiditerrae]